MKIIYKETLASTNTYAQERMEELEDKTFIYCGVQTKGKGQFARKWVSDIPENLYLTIVLKPESPEYPLSDLTMYLARVLVKVFKKYGVEAQIKSPNDIMVNGAKIAGILAKSSTKGQEIKGIALGVGVNLNFRKEELSKIDQKATALNLELRQKIDREEFLNNLSKEFLSGYDCFAKFGLEKNFVENN